MNLRYGIILDNFKKETGIQDARWVLGWEGFYIITLDGQVFKKNKYNALFKRLAISDKNDENAVVSFKHPFKKSGQTTKKDQVIYEAFIEKLDKGWKVVRDSSNFDINRLNLVHSNNSKTIGYYVDNVCKKTWSSINKAAFDLGIEENIIKNMITKNDFYKNSPFELRMVV
ncbi:hypothetical protein [Liquorilactobacillus mali]|uniref:Uncharacterized protein n=1 Tax=Liquorilactobacillus mali KCTC 3596 = DSM 20444 TaxID=1046596 RepID=A0A0R2E380_9LACO|nr:hypothetical protein [Liquorilactobacillus mali]KRN10769.1 hypothetical protein FD00_GL002011 [Liquorilactobacillus mali KCTC 3596 = DSM 20444]